MKSDKEVIDEFDYRYGVIKSKSGNGIEYFADGILASDVKSFLINLRHQDLADIEDWANSWGAIPETNDYANGWNDCRKELYKGYQALLKAKQKEGEE
jgi:hypothetical protein